MEGNYKFLLDLVIVLFAANIGGYLMKKMNQSMVLGQILAGLIVGPAVLGIIHETDFIKNVAEIGVLLLMFSAGLETELEDLKSSGKSASLIAIGGVVIPLILGAIAVMAFQKGADFKEAVFVGIILTATSVSLSVQVLREMDKLRTRVGIGILSAAVIDDVIGILLVTLAVSVFGGGHTSILMVILKIIAFFVALFLFGFIFSKLFRKYADFFKRENLILPTAIILCFGMAISAEEFGVAAIIGSYFMGVIFSTTAHRSRIETEVHSLASSIFIPIFFVNVGLTVSFQDMGSNLPLIIAILVASVIGKLIGCGLTAKMVGFSNRESLSVGIGMIPRGEVGLIVANLGLQMNLIGQDIFAAAILVVVVASVITPIFLKMSFKEKKKVA